MQNARFAGRRKSQDVFIVLITKQFIMKTVQNTFKKATLLCLFLVATSLSYGQMALEKVAPNAAIISFEAETVDYGTIKQNSDGVRTFTFTNNGNAPLIISDVKSSCGCTVPGYSKTPIMPGEKGEITVSYDTKRVGAFSKTITVSSNATEQTTQFKVKGNVVATK